MPFYEVAVMVPAEYREVVEADDEDEAIEKVADSGNAVLPYLGEGWSGDDDPDFDNAKVKEVDEQ